MRDIIITPLGIDNKNYLRMIILSLVLLSAQFVKLS